MERRKQGAGRTQHIRTEVSFSVQRAFCSFCIILRCTGWHIKYFYNYFCCIAGHDCCSGEVAICAKRPCLELRCKPCALHHYPTRTLFAHPFNSASERKASTRRTRALRGSSLMLPSQPSTATRPARQP